MHFFVQHSDLRDFYDKVAAGRFKLIHLRES
jgi:hypothetical protein